MKGKNVKCPECGNHNWSAQVYCIKCSNALYKENKIDKEILDKVSL